MGNCDNTVKRTPLRWWMRTSTKGGSLPKNGQQHRPLSERLWLFRWGKAQPKSNQMQHFESQIRPTAADGPVHLNGDSPGNGCRDTMSLLLRDVLVQRLEAERAAQAVGATEDLAAAPQPEVTPTAVQATALESSEAADDLPTRIPS